jgi:hypothetical protein
MTSAGATPACTGARTSRRLTSIAWPSARAEPHLRALDAISTTRLPNDERTIAEALKDAGYATGFFGKWHLGLPPNVPENQGFDLVVGRLGAGGRQRNADQTGGESARVRAREPRAAEGAIYEGGVRVPLIVAWPGRLPAGSLSDVPVSSIDLYPTILEMARLKPKQGKLLDGVSIMPVLEQRGRIDRDTAFVHVPPGQRARALPRRRLQPSSLRAELGLRTSPIFSTKPASLSRFTARSRHRAEDVVAFESIQRAVSVGLNAEFSDEAV